MTTVPRSPLLTPALELGRYATSRTARGSDAAALVDLCNDARGGHPGQRATINRNTGGEFTVFYDPRTSARIIEVAGVASWRGDWSGSFDVATVELNITDGTNTVPSSDDAIPHRLKGSTDYPFSPSESAGRASSMGYEVAHLDIDALVAAGLDPTTLWSFRFTIVCEPKVYLELLTLAEVSRFAVDALDDPAQYQAPRIPILSTLSRVVAALDDAHDLNPRTYHHVALAEADALLVTSGTFAAIPGIVQSESTGVPTKWVIPPRPMKATAGLQLAIRYKTSGADDGYIRLVSANVGNFDLTLTATSGVWVDATFAWGSRLTGTTDTLHWEAMVDGGTTYLATFWVADAPVP